MKKYSNCTIVAEACGNHKGDINIAKEMIRMAKLCGADYIKFQKRCPRLAVPAAFHNKPHPCPMHAFGGTYLKHREALEFTLEQHKDLAHYCDQDRIGYSCSVWDPVSAGEIISLNPDYIKIPSAMNNNYQLLDLVYREYGGDVHISLGMATKKEREELFKHIEDHLERTVIYWTTSGYPVKFEELFLLEIESLTKRFPRIGYSGHHLGIAVDIIAYTLGATWIERHFTLDRTWPGSDQAASIEPSGLQKLCRDIKAAQKALTYKNIDLTKDEEKNRAKLRIVTN